ncbi:MAG: DUF2849 domain-containing protein [Pseudomonadota bacterium]
MANSHADALQVITANHLLNGAVVYWCSNNEWAGNLRDAAIFDNRQQAQSTIDQLGTNADNVVGIEPIGVNSSADSGPEPLRLRERLRARGPSIPFGAAGAAG